MMYNRAGFGPWLVHELMYQLVFAQCPKLRFMAFCI